MNSEEIQSLIKQLEAQGLSEEQIMDVFYETFSKGEMDRKDLEALAEAMGYELTDEFKNDETPDPIAAPGSEESPAEGGISKEEAEAAKAIEPGQTAEEFKEEIEEMKDGESPVEEKAEEKAEEEKPEESTAEEGEEKSEEAESEESEKEDWDKAQKLFNI